MVVASAILIINHTMAPTDDPNVDKAIASAIDRNEIVDTVYGGNVLPAVLDGSAWFPGCNEMRLIPCMPPRTWTQPRNSWKPQAILPATHCKLDVWYPPEHYGASTVAWHGADQDPARSNR